MRPLLASIGIQSDGHPIAFANLKQESKTNLVLTMPMNEYRLNKIPFLLAVSCILAGFLIGGSFPLDTGPSGAPDQAADANTLLPRVFLDGHDEWEYIIGTNLNVCAVVLTGGLSLGFMSMANLAWIGLSTGWVVRSAMESGMSWERVAALTLPHGLLELAGFAMIAAVGCEGFVIVYRKLRYDDWSFSWDRISLNFRRLAAGLLLVLAASLVETYITGQIAAGFN